MIGVAQGPTPRGLAAQAPPLDASPAEVRRAAREGRLPGSTAGYAPGYAQANLVVLPRVLADDFRLFAQRNPKPCPVLEVLAPGDPVPRVTAPGADIRTDIPSYRVYRRGNLVAEVPDITAEWRDDLVAFLIGCSFTFEEALLRAGVPVRHLELGTTVPMYRTAVECHPAGVFRGRLVVTMRPIPAELVATAVRVTGMYPAVHGAPVQVGDPGRLGIGDLGHPDWGEPVPIRPGEVPVFWACGVTAQSVALDSGPELMITHSPGRMFVTDLPNETLLQPTGGSPSADITET